MPKTIASGSQSFYWECPCMKTGEGVIFKCRKRRDLWKRLHQSKCEYGDCDDIILRQIGVSNFEDNRSITEYTLRDRVKEASVKLNY